MKRPAKTAEECIDHLEAAVTALEAEGGARSNITAALLQLFITNVKKGRGATAEIDVAVEVLQNHAYRIFEQGKKDRAAKRNKTLKD